MHSKNYIPSSARAFLTWLRNLIDYVYNGGVPRFGISLEAIDHLRLLADDFEEKLNIADNPETRTKSAVQTKNDARKLAEKAGRQFVKRFLSFNPEVTNADRDNMGLPIPSSERHPAPVAEKAPFVVAEARGARLIRFDFGESNDSRTKPAGQHGVELISVISETKPAEIDELIRSIFDTRTPLILTFKESERGKTLWYAARWENTRGEKGPWSEIMSVIIP